MEADQDPRPRAEVTLLSDGIYVHRHWCPSLAGRLAWPAGPDSDAYWFGELCPKCRPLRSDRTASTSVVSAAEARRPPKMLVVYATRDGQTERIAREITASLRSGGAVVDCHRLPRCPTPEGYDAIVLGDPVRFSRHTRRLTDYLDRHADQLGGMPTSLFQVSMTSAVQDEAHTKRAQALMNDLIDQMGVAPQRMALFAGALRFTRYNRVLRRIMRIVARQEGLAVDGVHDSEFTNWLAVRQFADGVLADARARLAAR